MITHMKPVTDLEAISVNWEGLIIHGIADHQGNELLRKLAGTVVVRTPGDENFHSEGAAEGLDEMIRRGLRGAIG